MKTICVVPPKIIKFWLKKMKHLIVPRYYPGWGYRKAGRTKSKSLQQGPRRCLRNAARRASSCCFFFSWAALRFSFSWSACPQKRLPSLKKRICCCCHTLPMYQCPLSHLALHPHFPYVRHMWGNHGIWIMIYFKLESINSDICILILLVCDRYAGRTRSVFELLLLVIFLNKRWNKIEPSQTYSFPWSLWGVKS